MSNYNSQLQSNNTDLQTVLQTLQNKAAGGEQATPEISVNSTNGLITAVAGTKTSTHQLAFQSAKTITPNTASQVAVSSGYYTGGNITVAGDSNLIAGNIKSGVSIFGVNGTLVEGGGSGGEQADWSANEDAIITGTLSNYFNDRVKTIRSNVFDGCKTLTTVSFPVCTSIGSWVFNNCSSLTTASFPACTSIGSYAFNNCKSLTTISFPACKNIGSYAFYSCGSLTIASFPACTNISNSAFYSCGSLIAVDFPACTSIGGNAFYSCSSLTVVNFSVCKTIGSSAFYGCRSLTTASFPTCTSIGNSAFRNCYNLKSLFLTGSSICNLSNSYAFSSTPIGGYSASAGTFGSIYVPASLLTSYQTATNWTYFSSRFVAIGNTITFTIEGIEYQAAEGMTWGEWLESEYNTDGFVTATFGQVYSSDGLAVYYSVGLGMGPNVNIDDAIIADDNYRLS